ncbi:MAG: ATP synthase F1 subunit gamma [Candidatus Magasanikbacteria bacterium]|nr:ATP synthase F1 subunit gamma [Candidatus Magasanikbacteria bacterium]
MAVNTKAIKTRIKSVKNTKKMTNAMEMVSAAKMRKAVFAALSTRDYAVLSRELLHNLSGSGRKKVPLLEMRHVNKILVVLITSNRGLCGSFNANVLKKAALLLQNTQDVGVHHIPNGTQIDPGENIEIDILGIGKKSALFAKRYGYHLTNVFDMLSDTPSFEKILSVSRLILDAFNAKKYDKVVIVYTHYRSPLVQEVKLRQLLPVSEVDLEKMITNGSVREISTIQNLKDYIFEPNIEMILTDVLPRLVEIQLYEAILESGASEHSARMLAMKNASTAAGEMIDALTLEFNKARQASITQEIAEIAGGAAALE